MHPQKLHKIQAQGNDFLLIPNTLQNHFNTPQKRAHLANRRFGVGCDQIFTLTQPITPGQITCSIYNQDGNKADFCLNGLYALMCFIHTYHKNIDFWEIHLPKGSYQAHINTDGVFIHIPYPQPAKAFSVHYANTTLASSLINVGNQHLVLQKNAQSSLPPLLSLGKALQNSPDFKDGINVSILEILNQTTLALQTYERGCGPTYSCGSAGLAAACLFWQVYPTAERVIVQHPGGRSYYHKKSNHVWMQGHYTYITSFDYSSHLHPEKSQALFVNALEIDDTLNS